MNTSLLLFLMWGVTYPARLLGLSLGRVQLSEFWLNFLKFVPVSVFAALVVPDVLGPEWARRLPAALVAALLMLRLGNLALSLLGGVGAYWLARGLGL